MMISPDWENLQKRDGAHLPHWTCDNAIYHVVFKLADSLPANVVRELKRERISIIKNAQKANRELTDYEEQRLVWLYSQKIEEYLDAGHGACWLRQPAIAEIVKRAFYHFNGKRYNLHCWCIMPNHFLCGTPHKKCYV